MYTSERISVAWNRSHHDTSGHALLRERDTRAIVAQLVGRYDWRLLDADELVARAEALWDPVQMRDRAHAVFAVYTPLLYRACRGSDGPDAQTQGFGELWRYLSQAALRIAPELGTDDREELVSETLALVYERVCNPQRPDPVRVPHALLAVAAQQLRNTVRSWRRTAPEPWTDAAVGADDPSDTLVGRELEARVRHCFAECLRRYPRARLQISVVWLRHIEHLDNEAVMALLDLSSSHCRSLYSRGLRRLREDPAWQALAREWGMGIQGGEV